MAEAAPRAGADSGYQFGTFKGVYTPSVLTILGVVMYLRFGWVLGNVGLLATLLIVTLSTAITLITGLSLSSLATNMKVRGGGAYYIISRSLGVEAGAAVGLPLFFAQALGIAFYIAGFSEAFVDVFPQYTPTMVGLITLGVLALVAYISADLALKTQFIVMAVIAGSIVSFFLGGKPITIPMPLSQDIPPPESFWFVFAVFFPAVTGIEAGIAMSGDLRDPAKSLPRGTISAVATGYVIYMIIPIYLSLVMKNTDVLRAESMALIMRHVARWGSWIVLGVWAASLSSAMGALLGAPRTLQALARDRVIPRIFGRGFGRGNDPRIATATAFLVGVAGLLLGNLNAIAPVLSMFFLTSYGLLNVSAGLEELTAPPSWRPKFRLPWTLSFAGAFGCFAAMFMINAGATFVAAAVTLAVYFVMERRSLTAWWGDMRSGILMLIARNAVHALSRRPPDERTWKPNILVMSGSPTSRWYLIELAAAISQGRGFVTVAAILPLTTEPERLTGLSRAVSDYIEKHDVSAIVKVHSAESPLKGACELAKAYGYGPIAPNTILLGETERPENYDQFAMLIKQVHAQKQNLVVVREGTEEREAQGDSMRIDVWWYGTQQNLGLMLALAHLLTRGTTWRRSEFILKSIVSTEKDVRETRERIGQFIRKGRVDARAEVLVQSSSDVFDTIRQHSQGADLVLLGLRDPGEQETIESYAQYYRGLLANTHGLPPTALVLAAESIDFFGIFQQS
jgi:solute carrier family 12 sodium/potassium/chloride transporter 2